MKVEIISLDAKMECDAIVLPFWAPMQEKEETGALGSDAKKAGMKKSARSSSSAPSSSSQSAPSSSSGTKNKISLPAWASGLVREEEFTAMPGQMVMLRLNQKAPRHALAGVDLMHGEDVQAPDAARVILLGLGEKSSARAFTLAGFYAQAFNALKNARCKKIALTMPQLEGESASSGAAASQPLTLSSLCACVASQTVMADQTFDKYKPAPSEGEPGRPQVERLVLAVQPNELPAVLVSAQRGVLMGQAANFARAMQNEPANVASPVWVAEQTLSMAKKREGLKVKVLERAALKKANMNAMLAVAGEAAQEPRLVVLEYRGAPSRKGWDIAVVGKGVTFDSGGISIKPASKMDEMKFDKSGACVAIGTLMGAADLHLPLNVVGVAALAENMPDAQAYRPGDIITACNGTTIEVLNTDAEGRLVLADALAWTAKEYDPLQMVDLATLTGACVVALGDLASGVLSRDDKMTEALIRAGEATGERLWRLPLWPEYDDKIKSEIATIKNIGEAGAAGTIAGASFLRYFAGERAWAHIDIAGTADGPKPKAGMTAGGYGTGVRLMLEYLGALQMEGKKKEK